MAAVDGGVARRCYACAVCGQLRFRLSAEGKTGPGSESFGTVNPLQRPPGRRAGPTRVRRAATIGRYTQAVDNLWTTGRSAVRWVSDTTRADAVAGPAHRWTDSGGREQRRGGGTTVAETIDLAAVWTAATDELADEIISAQQRAYLRLTRLRAIVEDTALLSVPDAFTRDVIESRLRPAITEALSRRLGRPIQVAVTVRHRRRTPPGGRPAPSTAADRNPPGGDRPGRGRLSRSGRRSTTSRSRRTSAMPGRPRSMPGERPPPAGPPEHDGHRPARVPASRDGGQDTLFGAGSPNRHGGHHPAPERRGFDGTPPPRAGTVARLRARVPATSVGRRATSRVRAAWPATAPPTAGPVGRRRPPTRWRRPTRHGRQRQPAQPEVHVRDVRHRLVQPVRPRGARSRSPSRRPRRTTRCSSTAARGWARRTCCTRSGTTPRRWATPARCGTSRPRSSPTTSSTPCATTRPARSSAATATSTSC